MTSSHTLASITADLITNGIPRHFGEYPEDTSEEFQFPNHLCWFLDESSIDGRGVWIYNPGLETPAAIITWEFVPSHDGRDFDPSCDGWTLESARLSYCESFHSWNSYEEKDYDHTTIREAVALISFIDQDNAKYSIKAA
jgi:hypothetical protein